jgi:prepilin-type N-terminal cleavage/methylation domain-containing protein
MLRINTIISLNNKGDTIIEVMISMAILGLILGGAYYTANQSLNNIRAANEHSVAANIAQSQIEEIKIYNKDNPQDPFDSSDSTNSGACLSTSLNPLPGTQDNNIGGRQYWCKTPSNNPSNILNSAPRSASTAFYYSINVNCKPYFMTSTYGVASVNTKFYTYTVTVNWPTSAVTGSTRNQVVLNYRSN